MSDHISYTNNSEAPRINSDTHELPIELKTGHGASTLVQRLKDETHMLVEYPTEAIRKEFNADSHELAYAVPEIQGAIQRENHNSSIEITRDIGWHKDNREIPDPLITGYTNAELFAFIRRFNKDVFDVKAVSNKVVRGLDLNDAWSQDHAKDKLTLHCQRLYLTVVLSLASLGKQTSRLRSWQETRRTLAFCVTYFLAWHYELLLPLVLGILILVVSSVQARNTLFPPAPRALVNIKTGKMQKPKAGHLGTSDTLTGASEKQPFEAIEEEAANFVDNIRHNIQRAVGMHSEQQHNGDPLEGKVPKPVRKAIKTIQAAGSAPGHITETVDQTQEPMEEIIWAGVNPESISSFLNVAPHIVGEVADNWERFANAISPKPPFSQFAFLRIDAVLVPLFLTSLFVNYYLVYKVVGLAIGVLIFGNPVLSPAIELLQRKVPNYIELAEPKNNILRGVPTNSQIAITLLRIGEVNHTPVPPVPTSNADDPNHENRINAENIPLRASKTEVSETIKRSDSETAHGDEQESEEPKHKHLSKIVRLFKGNAKSVVETKLAIDHGRAALGSQKAKGHLGVLPKTESIVYTGPTDFKCRFNGKPGWAVITDHGSPSLLFTQHEPGLGDNGRLEPTFEIAVENLKRVKRATAFVNTAVESAAAFSSDKELLASLEVEDDKEKTWRLTAIPERDELFNRLVAIGGQRWENM